MGKKEKVVVGPNNEQTAVVVAAGSKVKAEGTIVVNKQNMPYRGARAAWYDVLCKYDGRAYSEFLAEVEANRPSVYGPKSRHAGQPEPVPGWVGFFLRNGIASVVK